MRFSEINWMDVEKYLKQDDRIMVVLGATEQHGYLSLLTDTRIPMALADAASQQTGVLIGPELNYGVCPYFMTYPGTLSLRSETLLMVVEDIISALYQHGFRRILVLNGHGGNEIAREKLVEISNKYEDLRIIWYAWWLSNSVLALATKVSAFTGSCQLDGSIPIHQGNGIANQRKSSGFLRRSLERDSDPKDPR